MKQTLSLITTLLLAPLAALHAAEPKVFDITAHGAKGDGTTMNTQAIQQAVDACHDVGGGVVTVPKGVFLTGSLRLKSGVILRIEKDAILRGSLKIADYAVETAELNWLEAPNFLFKSFNTQFRPALIYEEDAEQVGGGGRCPAAARPGGFGRHRRPGQSGQQDIPQQRRPAAPSSDHDPLRALP